MRILKWNLEIEDLQTLHMPVGAKVLTVQEQHSGLKLWALVDDKQGHPTEARSFAIYGTGNPMPANPGIYIATVQTHGGDFVCHVFEQG